MRRRGAFFRRCGVVPASCYRNAGGGSYLCKRARGSESARMVNVKSGWDFIAHGLRRYFDGSIEWDYSTGGCFGEVPV